MKFLGSVHLPVCFQNMQGFSQECLRGDVQKGGGSGGQSFKFCCLIWPILTEMTINYEILFYLPTRGYISPCGAEWEGVPTPPPPLPPGGSPDM